MSRNSGLTLWRDWGDPAQDRPESVFSFVMRVYGCTYSEALDRIEEDFFLNEESMSLPTIRQDEKITFSDRKKKKEFVITKRQLDLVDKNFWSEYGISIQTLNDFDVIGVEEVFMDNQLIKRSSKTRPIYAYILSEDGEIYYKIYDPLSINKKYKWLFNGNQDTLLGFDQLPLNGEYVVLTKSLKDIMSLYEYNIPAFSMQSENVMLKKDVYTKLKKRFDKIIVFYDNDEPGRIFSNKISNAYMLDSIFIPDEYEVKDISDFIKKTNKEEGFNLIKNLMTNIGISI